MTAFVIRSHLNGVHPKELMAEVRFTPTLNIQLITVSTSTSNILLKSRQQLGKRSAPFPISHQPPEEVQVAKVVIHNVSTGITRPSPILTEIASFNSGITLHHAPQWLTNQSKGWKAIRFHGPLHCWTILGHHCPERAPSLSRTPQSQPVPPLRWKYPMFRMPRL